MGRILFFFQEALRALRRNGAPSVAAIITTVVTVVLLGVLVPIFQTTQAKSDEVRSELNTQVEVFPDATKAELRQARADIAALPNVKDVEFVTKNEALAELRQSLGVEKAEELTSQLNYNPLPASFRVTPTDASDLPALEQRLEATKAPAVSSALGKVFGRNAASKEITKVTSALKIVLTIITALLVLASLMLIGNTIRLSIYTRRREVEVMRLVGATRWFIRWPFMIEGVIVGFAGGLLAIIILWLGKLTIVDPLSKTFHFLESQNDSAVNFPVLMVVLFAAAVLVSTLGSGITLRRFLKV
jgi:cell division transport system permease protein